MPTTSQARVPVVARALTSVVGWATELERADSLVRTPLALSRRVGVVAVEPGSGTSTVAAALVGLLARRRRGAVLGVDAGGGGLQEALGASAPEPAGVERLTVTDLSGPDESWPCPVGRWDSAVGPLSRSFDLVVTDWGTRPWAADLTDSAARGHVVVLVARADRRSALEAAAGLSLLRAGRSAPRAVLALVEVRRASDRVAGRLAEHLGVPVLSLPHDPALATAPVPDGRRLAARTRLALVRLGAQVVEEATLSAAPVRPAPQ